MLSVACFLMAWCRAETSTRQVKTFIWMNFIHTFIHFIYHISSNDLLNKFIKQTYNHILLHNTNIIRYLYTYRLTDICIFSNQTIKFVPIRCEMFGNLKLVPATYRIPSVYHIYLFIWKITSSTYKHNQMLRLTNTAQGFPSNLNVNV